MLIIPAIDLLNGQCVRLHQGQYDQVESYNLDPVAQAMSFVSAGAKRIHIVDLDAARTGLGTNRRVIKNISEALPDGIILEVGGGIRKEADVQELLDAGVNRLVVGTLLAKNPNEFSRWVKKFGGCFVAGLDAKDGEVKIAGWEEGGNLKDTQLASRCKELGAISIIYTNISRDGTLAGPDIERTLAVADASCLPVILSGGISSKEDFEILQNRQHPLLAGAITGKALYHNKFDLAQVMKQFSNTNEIGGVW